MLCLFALGAALVVPSPRASMAQHAQPTAEDPKRVEQQELPEAQVAAAIARARLAWAECKAELAAAEWRTLLRHYEARLKVVQDLTTRGRLCSVEPYLEAQGSVAVARAWLAEAEGKRDDLLAALPKVIAYHEWRIQRYQALRLHGVIPDAEVQAALKEPEKDLGWARQRLDGLRRDPASQDKTGKGEKQ
jgi:hypothetical protein